MPRIPVGAELQEELLKRLLASPEVLWRLRRLERIESPQIEAAVCEAFPAEYATLRKSFQPVLSKATRFGHDDCAVVRPAPRVQFYQVVAPVSDRERALEQAHSEAEAARLEALESSTAELRGRFFSEFESWLAAEPLSPSASEPEIIQLCSEAKNRLDQCDDFRFEPFDEILAALEGRMDLNDTRVRLFIPGKSTVAQCRQAYRLDGPARWRLLLAFVLRFKGVSWSRIASLRERLPESAP